MKRFKLAGIVAIAVCPLAALAQDGAAIRFGVDASFPPFESKAPDGKLVGFDIDIGNAICADLHAKCEWVEQTYDGMIPALKARKFDAILSGMVATPARREQIAFTNHISRGPIRLVARTSDNLHPTADVLRGKRVGVQQGSVQQNYAGAEWAPKGVVIVPYQNDDEIYQDLVTGRIDAALLAAVPTDIGFLKTSRGKGFSFAGGDIKDPRLIGDGEAIGVRRDDEQLKEKINQAMDDIRRNGTYQRIEARYFDFDIYN
jgi:lysine-arginine-ornithine-binding protein